MAKQPLVKPEEVKEEKPDTYKGYDIKWLKSEPTHPEFNLVAEYEAKFGEVE